MGRKKVVIIGSGFGGLTAAKWLKRADMDVLLVDRTNHHLFQPLLYQVATAALASAEIASSTRKVLSKQKNTRVIMGDVVAIDKTKNEITLAEGDTIKFDYLIVAAGARHSYFGNDHFAKFAPGLKSLEDALKIREKILLSFEKAEAMAIRGGCPQEAMDRYLNFVIIGGGPTGVEMAGAISEISSTIYTNFRLIKPEMSKVYLIEGSPKLLQMYPDSLSQRAKRDLEKLGVKVMTSRVAKNVTEDGVEIVSTDKNAPEELFIGSENVIWAAGNQASSLLRGLDTPLDRQGRAIVEKDLTVPGSDNIFVIGDAAHIRSDWEKENSPPLPALAPLAIQTGKWVGHYIRNEIQPAERLPFIYFDKGSLSTIGKGKAVGTFKNIRFTGIIAWVAWCFVHIYYLIGFRNRLSVLIEWAIVFLTGQRGVRLIYKSSKSDSR